MLAVIAVLAVAWAGTNWPCHPIQAGAAVVLHVTIPCGSSG